MRLRISPLQNRVKSGIVRIASEIDMVRQMKRILGKDEVKKDFKKICKNLLPNGVKSSIILSVAGADVAQQVERILGKDEVTGSNPVISSI